ncbi:hypothetical protein IAT40_001781 [Kwoniella sp. CBS 6097]
MARPHPAQNVSFQDDIPPSRRAGRDDQPPRPPAKTAPSKNSLTTVTSGTSSGYNGQALGYDDNAYVDVGSQNPQGFSSSNGADMRRKKSLVRPERERIDPGHRLWHYREHAEQDQVDVQPTTGNQPYHNPRGANLRRGKSLLARETDEVDHQSGLNIFKRGATIRRRASQATPRQPPTGAQSNRAGAGTNKESEEKLGCLGNFAPGPKDAWMVYCYLLTFLVPGFVLRNVFGKRTPEAQRAWREKMGIVGIVAGLMAIVGFVTFGFTQTVCGNTELRIAGGGANNGSLVINGYDYDFSKWRHPAAGNTFNGSTSPLYMDEWMAGGKDASFMFQNVNRHCLGVITPASGSGIQNDGRNMAWYLPCNLHDQNGTSALNLTGYTDSFQCHTSSKARQEFEAVVPTAQIYYTWGRVKDESRNLAVYKS